MKIFETSILELVCKPLILFRWCQESLGDSVRKAYVYEHVISPAVFAMAFHKVLPCKFRLGGYLIFSLFFIFGKEVVFDVFVKKQPFNKSNFIERLWGATIGLILL